MQDATSLSPDKVYARRFEPKRAFRVAMWQVLCRDFFQAYIPVQGCVVEVAAGHCEFINQIQAARRLAVDINPDTAQYAGPGVETHLVPATELESLGQGMADAVFVSNFFEHISKPDIVKCLRGIFRLLKPGGRLLILQPNVRYCAKDYWMFFDHVTPVDDRALVEVLEVLGYRIQRCIPRFLPYTTQSRMPQTAGLVKWYLRLPFLWRFLGAQTFVCAERPTAG